MSYETSPLHAEHVADGATMVDFAGGHPETEEAAAVIAALDDVLGSEDRRRELRAAGRRRASTFSWRSAADELLVRVRA